MGARLVILIAIAIGLAVYFTSKGPAGPKAVLEDGGDDSEMSSKELENIRRRQIPLGRRHLPGEEPKEAAQLSIQVEVDNSKGKNRLVFTMSEAHGYYVETFDINFWYKKTPVVEFEDSPLQINHVILNRYLPARETLKECIELNDAEMLRINKDMGTGENWGVEIRKSGRARAENPNPLPELDVYPTCR